MIETASGQQCRAADGHCITCGDEGVLMWVESLAADGAVCVDEHRARHERIAVELVGPVSAGDAVLVHAGVAIGRAHARLVEPDRRSSDLVRTRTGMARGGIQ